MLSDRAQRRIDGLLDQAESVASANNGETMPFWKTGTSHKFLVWTVIVFAFAIASLGCGSSNVGDPPLDEASEGAPPSTQPSPTSNPAVDREKVEISWLKEGNFWKLSWSEIESNRTWTERGGRADSGVYSLTLGPKQEISGYEMYEVILNGDFGDYSPGWDFIGTDTYGGVFGRVSGIDAAVLLYSVEDSGEPKAGFYANFEAGKTLTTNRNARMIPSQFTNQVPHFEGNITGIGYSGGGRQVFQGTGCDYYPGVGTICGGGTTLGPSREETHIEYWSANAGPIGMHYSFDFEDCLGTACNEKHIERRVEARYFGDAAGSNVGSENEPDTYVDPSPIDLEGPIRTVMGEIN